MKEEILLSFPGLGIPEFTLNPVVFSIGSISVRWYGLIITIGIILAFSYCVFRAKQEKISFEDLIDIAIFTIIFAVLGARAYYVITSWNDYNYDSFYDVIAIWEGGLAIYGAIIAGAITIICVCKYKKINYKKMLDVAAPAVMIGQILGRWGNFFNGEAYGGVVPENSIWYFIRMGIYPNNIEGVRGMAYVHPTFLYESVWNLIGFIIINSLYKKKKFDGQILLMYITWYGFGRMLIEGLRTDSLYVGVFRISQVVGFLCFVIGAILLVINLIKAKREQLNNCEYIPTYAKISKYEMPDESISALIVNEIST
jgi:phosphatidylglycerol:prolipoprotein diacylglycerol transferase